MSQPTLRPILVLAEAIPVATALRLSVTGESELDQFPGAMPEVHRMSVQQQVRGWDEASDDLIVERGHEVCEIGRTFLTQPVLVLDSEAVSALARPRQDTARHELVRAAMRSAHTRNIAVRVPSAVLVELYRGGGTDEAIDQLLARGFTQVITTGARIARIAGHLLAEAHAGSELAIEALVVATAVRYGGGAIVTHDPADIALLAAQHPNVSVISI